MALGPGGALRPRPPARPSRSATVVAVACWLFGLALVLPLILVAGSLLKPRLATWQHLSATVLPGYLLQSFGLCVGVMLVATLLATPAAWFLSVYRLRARGLLDTLLLLPAALPAYIVAYAYSGLLDFGGLYHQVYTALAPRAWRYHAPPLHSLGGAVLVLAVALYPYLYVLLRAVFSTQAGGLFEAGRALGLTPAQVFFSVALPLARPALMVGTALIAMEALADYGTVHYLGVSTLSVGVFRTWFGLGDRLAASQLAALLMLLVGLVIALEQAGRQRVRYHPGSRSLRPAPSLPLRGLTRFWAALAIGVPVLLGFVLPVSQLLRWAWPHRESVLEAEFLLLLGRSLGLAAGAALLTVLLAWLLLNGARLRGQRGLQALLTLTMASYAMPGVVIAVGVLLPLAWFDNQLDALARAWFDWPLGLIITGSVLGLLLAYVVRFQGIAQGSLRAGAAGVSPHLEEAAANLGAGLGRRIARVQWPVLRNSLAGAGVLVFVEVLKELPATLLLRPFDFNTLAVRAHELASDERLAEAAPAALALLLVGLLPVQALARALNRPPAGLA